MYGISSWLIHAVFSSYSGTSYISYTTPKKVSEALAGIDIILPAHFMDKGLFLGVTLKDFKLYTRQKQHLSRPPAFQMALLHKL